MKIVVIGGSGLIGSKVVTRLNAEGHEAVAASPNSGVNTLTGEGLADVLAGASVVVDVSNSPSFEEVAVMKFFETSTRNLLSYEASADVKHHVALSVVGTDRLSESGYFRAKIVQEKMIQESPMPYSIVHATQFFEFVKSIADAATSGNTVRLAPVLIQPMAADDVASAVCKVALGTPLNATVEVAGPERFRLDELIRQGLRARNDAREVIADTQARYFGALLSEDTLIPGPQALRSATRFEDWLSHSAIPVKDANPLPAALKDNEFRITEVPPGRSLSLGNVAVFNVAGTFFATQARCTHMQGPLSDGKLVGSTVTCPLHGAQFNVSTGAVLHGPAKVELHTYRVTVAGEVGRVEVAATAGAAAI